MKKRVLYSIMVLALVLMLMPAMAISLPMPVWAATPGWTGNVEADFTGPSVLIIPDPDGQNIIVTSDGAPPGTISGWDIKDLRLTYNANNDTLYVGVNFYGIAGDADGDGDPGGGSYFPPADGWDDPDLSQQECISVYFDLNKDGNWDIIAGVPAGNATKNITAFTVANWLTKSYFGPPYSTELPLNKGTYCANPSASAPDFEFTILNFSSNLLPGWDSSLSGFRVHAFAGSLDDGAIGEDDLEYEQNPHTVATISVNATKVKSGNSVSLNISEANYPVSIYSQNITSPQVAVTKNGVSLANLTSSDAHSGDTDIDGVLDVSENWTWYNVYGGPITGLTTFVARGNGTAPGDFPVNYITDPLETVNVTADAINPNICINKTVDCNNDGVFKDVDLGYAGDTAHWKVVVWNCGDSNLTNVTVSDTNLHNFGAPFNLPAGAPPVEFNYDKVVSVNTTNNATVTATDLMGGTVSAWDIATNNVMSPCISINKTVDCNNDGIYKDVDVGYAGDNAHWKIIVKNCGDATLSSVNTTDTNGQSFGPTNLAPGQSVEYNYDKVVSVNTTNNATAKGVDVLGKAWSASDIATNNVMSPCISINKTVDCNNDGIYKDVDVGYAGDNAHWKIIVKNCGDATLSSVNTTDTNGQSFGPTNLAPGQSVEYNYDTVVSVNTTNNATAKGVDVLGKAWSASDIATNNVMGPCISVNKTVDCNNDGIYKDVDVGYAGDNAHWKIIVKNCGDATLFSVNTTDTNGQSFGPTNLAPGQSVEYNYDTVVSVNTTNNATAKGVDVLGKAYSASDIATNNVINPKLCIDKTVDCNDDGVYSKTENTTGPSDNADWKVVVTNCGTDPVYNITVTDTNGNDFSPAFNLTVGENKTFTYTTTISATTTNTAKAEGKDAIGGTVGPVSSSATNRIVGIGCLQICKFEDANVNGIWDPGEEGLPNWRFEVTGPDNYDTWVTTGPDGCVVVNDLVDGTYTVTEELQNGWYNTWPGGDPPYKQKATVTIGATCARVEFGNREEIKDVPPLIPTLNKWGIIAMIILFTGLVVWTVRRKRLGS